uniref:G-protein coupled receptors family 1 profile domain-containing protein n=1 Tax=Plectus sambesii TaxID=2011161 RepID=A0A914WS66_9BILA
MSSATSVNGSTAETMAEVSLPLNRITSDYIEILFLALMIVVGIPINLHVLRKLLHLFIQSNRPSTMRVIKRGMLMMKLNLNISNLFILCTYCPVKIAWLLSYQWRAGDLLCKVTHFVWVVAFTSASNIVACIALDRAVAVRGLLAMRSATSSRRTSVILDRKSLWRVRILLTLAWFSAILWSVPQLALWGVIELPESGSTWVQCTSVWRKASVCRIVGCSYWEPPLPIAVYLIYHLAAIFWAPFVLVVVSYVYVAVRLFSYSCSPISTTTLLRPERHRSYSQSAIVMIPNLMHFEQPVQMSLPAWRSQMRSKVFRTAAIIVSVHSCCWLPYSIMSLIGAIGSQLDETAVDHIEFAKWLIIVDTVINPFIYGFQSE